MEILLRGGPLEWAALTFYQPKMVEYRGLLSLNQSIYTANCEPNTVIMHPLPRDSRSDANELDSDLYENPNLAIFRQADNGVVIRMAIFALVLDIEEKIEETSRPVNWKVGLKD